MKWWKLYLKGGEHLCDPKTQIGYRKLLKFKKKDASDRKKRLEKYKTELNFL